MARYVSAEVLFKAQVRFYVTCVIIPVPKCALVCVRGVVDVRAHFWRLLS
jgi:hypothetical protein